MLTKRIIPCLDIKDGRTVKGVNFKNLVDAGDPVENARFYSDSLADELVFLDITATVEKRRTLYKTVKEVARAISIPFTVGGGIKEIDDCYEILSSGADKISINSSAVRNPKIIDEFSKRFGSQAVIVAIDALKSGKTESGYEVFVDGGRTGTGLDALTWAKEAEERGAGEILLTSMDADGVKKGFSVDLNSIISSNITIPLIASGGAGRKEDFKEVFTLGRADAALAASVFHYRELDIPTLKGYLKDQGIPVRI